MNSFTSFCQTALETIGDQNIILILLLNAFMIFATYTDIKSMKIYNKFNIVMLVTRIISFIVLFSMNQITLLEIGMFVLGAIIMFLAFLIPAMITLDSIGGDIKFAFNVGLWVGTHGGLLIAVIASITNFLFRIFFVGKDQKDPYMKIFLNVPVFFKAKKVVPLGPFFYLGYLILLGLYFII